MLRRIPGFKTVAVALCIGGWTVAGWADDTFQKGADSATATATQPFVGTDGSMGGIPVEERQVSEGPGGKGIMLGTEAHPFTLPQLLDEALRRNPSTREQWELTLASVANLGIARSAYYPTVTLSGSGGPTYQTTPAFEDGAKTSGFSYGPEVQVNYLLFDFGARADGVEAARFQLLANNYNQNSGLENVILQVEKAYYALDGAKANLTNAQVALKYAESSAENARRRAEIGLGTRTAVLEAEQTAAQNRYNLENAKGTLATAQVTLATAIGLPGNAQVYAAPPSHLPTSAQISDSVDVMIDHALRHRPDLAEKFATYKQDKATAKQADANVYPEVSVGGSADRSYFNDKVSDSAFGGNGRFNGSSDDAQAQLTISIDLFDGWYKVNQARYARREADAAKADLANTELTVISDVVTNFVAFKTALEEYKAGEALVESSQKSFDSTSISYKAGLSDILDLLTAQSNLASAQATLAQSRTGLFTASAQLANSTGALLPQGLAEANTAAPVKVAQTGSPTDAESPAPSLPSKAP